MRVALSAGALVAFFVFTVVPGRTSLVHAQSLAALPTCAQPAILAAVQASGCAITDKKCFCSNPALIPSLTSAVREACSAADQAALAAFASTYCGSGDGSAFTAAPSTSAELSSSANTGSSATTIPPATSSVSTSVSVSSSTITSTTNMTMNSTMMMTSTHMSISTSSIHWPTNVTTGNAAVETGLAMAALAVAAGAMGVILGEF